MPLFLHNGIRPTNRLLSGLTADEQARLIPHLQPVKLDLGAVVCNSPADSEYAYFPTTSVCSIICDMEDGATAEVSLIGNDGLVGTSLYLCGRCNTDRVIVGIAGEALRLHGSVLRKEFQRGGAFQSALLRYTDTFIGQISLTAACNRKHSLEKRLCRWLLLIRDRAGDDELAMTQEFIANILGGRRETVTVAAGHLQDAGMIQYSRGRIRILNRGGLEACACDCYRAIRSEANRVLAFEERTTISPYPKSRAGCA